MVEPKWEIDQFGGQALVVEFDTYQEVKARGTLKELADSFGMNGRAFVAHVLPNRYAVALVPPMLATYGCEHRGEVRTARCPSCGADVVCWQ